MWIVPGPDVIEIQVRALTGGAPTTGRIPDQGPWRLPDPLPDPGSIVHEQYYVSFTPARTCPHCQQASSSYRHLEDGWLVCQACGRSFARERLGSS